jgi:hypothetical protein
MKRIIFIAIMAAALLIPTAAFAGGRVVSLITGSQIAAETITGTNIKDGSLEAKELSATAQASLHGTTVHVTGESVSFVNNSAREIGRRLNAIAYCPTGMRVTGGGGSVDNPRTDGLTGALTESKPAKWTSPDREGWVIDATLLATIGNGTDTQGPVINAFAVCES